jgi:hypothetical protein
MPDTRLVYRNPHPQHHADFADVALAANGDVLVLLRQCGAWAHEATFGHGRPLTFFEADAKMLPLRSTDGGRAFAAEGCLFRGLAYDPMLCSLPDGRLMAGMVVGEAGRARDRGKLQGVLHRHLPQLDTVICVHGVALWVSEDDGRTWSPAPTIVAPPGWENTYNLRRVFALTDGTLIMPVTVGYPWRTRYVGLIRSWDGGATWGDPSYVAEDPPGRAHYAAGVGYWQPAMAATPEGDLVCVCVLDDRDSAPQRTAHPGGPRTFGPTDALPSLVCTYSLDSGFTWSQPEETGLRGDFPSMANLPDGRLLLTLTQRCADGSAVLAHVSRDGGASWSAPHTVREATDHLFYYPNTAALPDGALLTVFTTGQPDLVRVVEAVRWEQSPSEGACHPER